jgi:hypothetical protein
MFTELCGGVEDMVIIESLSCAGVATFQIKWRTWWALLSGHFIFFKKKAEIMFKFF